MPKATKEETLKKKMQARALYELGKYTKQEIYEKVKIDHKTLSKWINKDPSDIWKVGGRKEDLEKQKEALQPFIKETVQKTITLQEQKKQELQPQEKTPLELQKEKAKDNAKQVDELTKAITEQFFEEEKIKEFVLSTGLLGMHRIRQLWLTNKQYYKNEEQTIGLQSATNYLRLSEAFDNIAGTLGFGMPKGVNIFNQNNNNAEAKVESLEYTKTQDEKAQKLLASVIPQDE